MRVDVLPADRWAAAVAEELAARLAVPGARICLPTGATPSPAYERVPAALQLIGADAGRAIIVQLDEYVGLPPHDPARCDGQLRRQLIDRLSPRPRFLPIPVDDRDPQAAAAALDRFAAEGLDLAVVGLGHNGHVGMNEPGSGPDAATRAVAIEPEAARHAIERYGATTRPTGAITLGLSRLLEARELWLLVTGPAKADVLGRAVDGPMSADVPASFLRRHPRARVIADEPAATRLAAASPEHRSSAGAPG